ncbi:MAG TPA: hypothetical protein PLO29_06280 [Paludibacter sp.]|nr:MAG: hypothetical protein BWY08_00101 [Bacteroidetes bacterium ADurb.Bin174]HQB28540.1 hypothetical protein [Paludibacter sp.]
MKLRHIVFGIILFSINLTAQHKNFIGFGVVSEMNQGKMLHDNVSFSYERQFHKFHGLLIELNRRQIIRNTTFYNNINLEYLTSRVREKYLSIPVSYKFYSKIVNISTGFNLDYFVGWENLLNNSELTSYNINPRYSIGWNIKISKTIPLYSQLYLEPEIFYNPIFLHQYAYYHYGIGAKLKYELK